MIPINERKTFLRLQTTTTLELPLVKMKVLFILEVLLILEELILEEL